MCGLVLGCGPRAPVPGPASGARPSASRELAAAKGEEERFFALREAAKESFVGGRIDDARAQAQELLTLAPRFPGSWNYGNAVHDGNLVLGRIAVSEGRIEDARRLLLAAGRTSGSPQLDTFGPNMSLAKDLLEKGEKDVVLEYLELCRSFWDGDGGLLERWERDIREGRVPDFGTNLVY